MAKPCDSLTWLNFNEHPCKPIDVSLTWCDQYCAYHIYRFEFTNCANCFLFCLLQIHKLANPFCSGNSNIVYYDNNSLEFIKSILIVLQSTHTRTHSRQSSVRSLRWKIIIIIRKQEAFSQCSVNANHCKRPWKCNSIFLPPFRHSSDELCQICECVSLWSFFDVIFSLLIFVSWSWCCCCYCHFEQHCCAVSRALHNDRNTNYDHTRDVWNVQWLSAWDVQQGDLEHFSFYFLTKKKSGNRDRRKLIICLP